MINSTRPNRVIRKVRRSLRDRTFTLKFKRRLVNLVAVPQTVIRGDRARRAFWTGDLVHGARDHRGSATERTCSDVGLQRIITAYNSAVVDVAQVCPPELEVRGVWAEWLDLNYAKLRTLLASGDLGRLRSFLENIHREPSSTGVGGTYDDYDRYPWYLRAPYFRATWTEYRQLLEQVRPDWSDVASVVVGNPVGAELDGRLVQIETLRHAHHATWLLGERAGRPLTEVLEIGAGLGGQALQFVNLAGPQLCRYTVIDLPEVAALSAFVLMSALGEDRVSLYGEPDSESKPALSVRVLPPWSIREVPPRSIDLIFNSYSFSEMDAETSSFYLREIERICRGDFFHVNHETRFVYTQADGTRSFNRIGSEMVPDAARFRLVWRRPRTFSRPENTLQHGYAYLYRLIS